ncbi:MAG: hypothetical protein QOK17_2794 [Sphingomonadales bacterium]|jgi:hypothetical protein|nr:hypothetical protein [Sphingomonadales bacterium]
MLFDEVVTKARLESALQKLELRLTIRMGVLAAATITILGAVIRLH